MHSPERPTYLVRDCQMPFCRGCGHTHVLRKLNDALVSLALDPADVCLVTDIGCIGLADALFETPHSVHTTHGRSTAFATGIALADGILASRNLKTIVLIGDGGAMIGLLHLVSAALLNVDVTVVLCNNFLFGMTGGQHSSFSPLEFVTPTTPSGNIVPPLDACGIATAAHAGFVARQVATDPALAATLADAIAHPGFSLVEVVELCTEHGTTRNPVSGGKLEEIVRAHGQELGRIAGDAGRRDFAAVYRGSFPPSDVPPPGEVVIEAIGVPALERPLGIVLAGSAGEKVQSAAYRFCLQAIGAGLYCTQKNDNPVAQGAGFSLSELVLSPEPVLFTGIEVPDFAFVVSIDGWRELEVLGVFSRLAPTSRLLLDDSLPMPVTAAQVSRHPFRGGGGRKAAVAALDMLAANIGLA